MILILKYLISYFLMEMVLPPLPMVYIFRNLFVLRVDDFNNRKIFLTAKLLNQDYRYHKIRKAFSKIPGSVAKSIMCLATDARLTEDPGVAISIPARFYTFLEIDHEIISAIILLPSAESFKKGCCQ